MEVFGSRNELPKGLAPDDDRGVLCRINACWHGNNEVFEGFDVPNSDHAVLEPVEVGLCFNEFGREIELVVRPRSELSGE